MSHLYSLPSLAFWWYNADEQPNPCHWDTLFLLFQVSELLWNGRETAAVKTCPLHQTLRIEREKERHNYSEKEELLSTLFIRISKEKKQCPLRCFSTFKMLWSKDRLILNGKEQRQNNKCIKKTKPYIYGTVRIDKQIAPADATIHAAQSQTETKGEEVTMIVMANTVVKPSWI